MSTRIVVVSRIVAESGGCQVAEKWGPRRERRPALLRPSRLESEKNSVTCWETADRVVCMDDAVPGG